MDEPACPGCRALRARNAELERRVARLEALVQQQQAQIAELLERLNRNASNSSLPPSANPPAAPPAVVKKPTGRKPGGQPGHPPFLRLRLPADRVHHLRVLRPTHCRACQTALPRNAGPHDPEPSWHQVLELPAQPVTVTEYQGHSRTCPACGVVTQAAIPAAVKAHCLGPRLTAALLYLMQRTQASKRAVEDIAATVLGVPVSLGTVCHLQAQMSAALAAPVQAVAQAVQAAPHKYVDETSWAQAGRRCWLWVAVTASATLFVIHARRSAAGLTALLGESWTGSLSSDRWTVYDRVAVGRRQLCWAHLRRDFQAMAERGGPAAEVGRGLLEVTDVVLSWWYKVRDGTRRRRWLQRLVAEGARSDLRVLLQRGQGCGCAKTAATCTELWALEPAVWTFVAQEGIEPTNNAAERALRPAVLWRKRSFGCHSEAGCRFVERLLTVVQTLRQQGRDVLEYLHAALSAYRQGQPAPQLLSTD